ncbi:MAG: hypothetical protein C0467_14080 [Planctomycetaceae bacterium]|nr:hypothetical protein [Planctomycetaceae bacterium]
MKPAWLGDFKNGLGIIRDGAKATGDELLGWGNGLIDSFGNSDKAINAFFDNIMNKQAEVLEQKKKILTLNYNPVGAMLKGSTEAFSLTTKFTQSNKLDPKIAKQEIEKKQLEVAQKQLQQLNKIAEQRPISWHPEF